MYVQPGVRSLMNIAPCAGVGGGDDRECVLLDLIFLKGSTASSRYFFAGDVRGLIVFGFIHLFLCTLKKREESLKPQSNECSITPT